MNLFFSYQGVKNNGSVHFYKYLINRELQDNCHNLLKIRPLRLYEKQKFNEVLKKESWHHPARQPKSVKDSEDLFKY